MTSGSSRAAPPPLTPAVFHTLLALSEGAQHGYAIAQEVERVTEGRVRMGPGTLYGTLQRLQEQGLITESEPPPEAGGSHAERRRYYLLTPEGRAAAAAELRRLEAAVSAARGKIASDLPGRV